MSNRVDQLRTLGQSVWLDFIRRDLLRSGELDRLIHDHGVVGVTSNPTIFQQAIAESRDYDDIVLRGVAKGLTAPALFDALTIEDIQLTCDRLRPIHQRTGRLDGRVSIEVNPHLAHDAEGTLAEARRLVREVGRINLMVKIPATREGLVAIAAATAEGICVNVTLIFSLARYEQVMEAYLQGLETRVAKQLPVDTIFSVASFFVSRVDTKVDQAIAEVASKVPPYAPRRQSLDALAGTVGIANARLAYARFRHVFGSPRFEALRARGARVQRPLWASTGTKNPAYRDTLYVDELIGADTVNTMPLHTLAAFDDHGTVAPTIERDFNLAQDVFRRLPLLGVRVEPLIDALEEEGVAAFTKSYDAAIETLESRRRELHGRRWVSLRTAAGPASDTIQARIARLEREGFARRLWQRETALWSRDPAHQQVARNRLGWLDVPERMKESIGPLQAFARDVRAEGFTRAVLLGMGGSSLAPEVMRSVFGVAEHGLELSVLDSTSPAAVRAVAASHAREQTLVIVSSKSGTTLEVSCLEKHFYEWMRSARRDDAGKAFVAITDPGTPLEKLARARRYRRVFLNPPDIGGRYSALSFFGLVPAALLGIDLEALLEHAIDEARSSGPLVHASRNFGLELGAALGELALAGRDKVTLVMGPKIEAFGGWVEQLLAESTGKDGKGLIPVTGESLGSSDLYGNDRAFVAFSLAPFPRETESLLDALERAGHPVLRWRDLEVSTLGAEFFRWEIATVVAAAVLGVDPFDEPNVTEAKQATQSALAAQLERAVADPAATPGHRAIAVEAPPAVTEAIRSRVNGSDDPAAWAAAILTLARPGDYLGLLAYLHRTPERHQRLERLRLAVRRTTRLPTTLGYGPRYLHSTGQLHKGGPDTGIFLQLTVDEGDDVPIPDERYGFAALIRAQAEGDYQVLARRGRRVMRIHLGPEPEKVLDAIAETIAAARV